jgi:hypothetical protein
MARLKAGDLPDGASKIFFGKGLDTISENQPAGQITWESAPASATSWFRAGGIAGAYDHLPSST